MTSGLSLTSVQTAGAHRRSSVWNTACCTWNGQVETDALSRFSLTHDALQVRLGTAPSRTAVLTHDALQVRLGTAPSRTAKRLLYQRFSLFHDRNPAACRTPWWFALSPFALEIDGIAKREYGGTRVGKIKTEGWY